MDSEVDDPVIKECDVYLSQKLEKGLYVLHYPLRPIGRPESTPDVAFYRPKNEMIELHYQLAHDYHYDIAAPEQQRIDKIKLVSNRHPDKANYAIGVMRDGCLHLTPVRSTLYMRPDLTHMNQEEEEPDEDDEMEEAEEDTIEDLSNLKKKPRKRPTPSSSTQASSSGTIPSNGTGPNATDANLSKSKGLTEVHVEYSKKYVDDPFRGPRNYVELQAIINDEPWIPVQVHSLEHPASQNTFNQLICTNTEENIPSISKPNVYTSTLKKAASAIYPDSAVDPEWKSLASPNYPGYVDSKEWIELRNLREKVKNMKL